MPYRDLGGVSDIRPVTRQLIFDAPLILRVAFRLHGIDYDDFSQMRHRQAIVRITAIVTDQNGLS
ncbi:hypothetical protein [Methylotenera sp.]|uniref:hypothetical protein n=1 Tax=Methylotenera sp. TaxID=2051956 RepID=UPI002486CFFC|nr:hypothetical protein [Methylotenera sp.]MDI1298783.1 hypothetical protein [Methylotenera sp.]